MESFGGCPPKGSCPSWARAMLATPRITSRRVEKTRVGRGLIAESPWLVKESRGRGGVSSRHHGEPSTLVSPLVRAGACSVVRLSGGAPDDPEGPAGRRVNSGKSRRGTERGAARHRQS